MCLFSELNSKKFSSEETRAQNRHWVTRLFGARLLFGREFPLRIGNKTSQALRVPQRMRGKRGCHEGCREITRFLENEAQWGLGITRDQSEDSYYCAFWKRIVFLFPVGAGPSDLQWDGGLAWRTPRQVVAVGKHCMAWHDKHVGILKKIGKTGSDVVFISGCPHCLCLRVSTNGKSSDVLELHLRGF